MKNQYGRTNTINSLIGVLAETRTLDPLIKSQLLYQLSYEDWNTGLCYLPECKSQDFSRKERMVICDN